MHLFWYAAQIKRKTNSNIVPVITFRCSCWGFLCFSTHQWPETMIPVNLFFLLEKQTLILASQVTEEKKDIKTKTKIMIRKNMKKIYISFYSMSKPIYVSFSSIIGWLRSPQAEKEKLHVLGKFKLRSKLAINVKDNWVNFKHTFKTNVLMLNCKVNYRFSAVNHSWRVETLLRFGLLYIIMPSRKLWSVVTNQSLLVLQVNWPHSFPFNVSLL